MFDDDIIEAIKPRLLVWKTERLYVFLSCLRWYKNKNNEKKLVEVLYSNAKSPIVNVEKLEKGVFNEKNILNVHKNSLSEIDITEKAFIFLLKKSEKYE